MSSFAEREAEIADIAEHIGQLALADEINVAVAESLTSGRIAQALGAATDSSEWFAGAVIAYQHETKYSLLNVDHGPVITAACAEQMSTGVLHVTQADASVSVAGVGGPGPEEGHPQGTVFIAASFGDRTQSFSHYFEGEPLVVVQLTTIQALRHLKAALLAAGE